MKYGCSLLKKWKMRLYYRPYIINKCIAIAFFKIKIEIEFYLPYLLAT